MAFIQLQFKIADGLTKFKENTIPLETLLTSQLDHAIQKWTIKSAKGGSVVEEGVV